MLRYHINVVCLDSSMPLSGKEMRRLYEQAGWIFVRQNGTSHVIMGRGTERESIPMHRELKKGLERKLLKRIKGSGK